jgi:hypothetical protein
MTTRDPRRDPKVGDELKSFAFSVQVIEIRDGFVFYLSGRAAHAKSCDIHEWRIWARNAEVLHVAE